jgi:hypothetical protein
LASSSARFRVFRLCYAIASVLVFPAVFFPFADPAGHAVVVCGVFIYIFGRPIGTLVFMWFEKRYRAASADGRAVLLGVYRGYRFPADLASLGMAAICCRCCAFTGVASAVLGWTVVPAGDDGLKEKRGWWAMIPQLGAPIGLIAASLFLYLHPRVPKTF